MADDATKKVEAKVENKDNPSSAPVLPLRDIVVFPPHDRSPVRGPRKVGARPGGSDE